MTFTVGSLFSGIGGIDLGLERAGMTVRWQSEVDEYASKVLAEHWPDVPNLGDITTIDWSTVERVDLICGGFPCQPVSVAGARKGQADKRWLWPFYADAVRRLRPRYVFVENVPGLLSADEGSAFGGVLSDLAGLGFDAAWASVPAAAFGAPHLRYRVCLVAHAVGVELRDEPWWRSRADGQDQAVAGHDGADRALADTDGAGRRELRRPGADAAQQRAAQCGCAFRADPHCPTGHGEGRSGEAVLRPEALERPGRLGGDRDHWATEPDVGRVAHGVPKRVDRLRALGNAVVPQMSEWVGRQILEHAR